MPCCLSSCRTEGSKQRDRRAGDFLYLSGTSCREPDNSLPGVTVDETGAARLDVCAQTYACIENLGALAARVAGEQNKRAALLGIGGLSGLTGDRMQELETAGVT